MLTSLQALNLFGKPGADCEARFFTYWDIPADINAAIPALPNKLYCNKVLVAPLEKALRNLIAQGHAAELKTFDGCYSIRTKKGNAHAYSLHSWAIAIDVNAAWNAWQKPPTLSPGFVKCFIEAGFEWGGFWSPSNLDGMHFQLAEDTINTELARLKSEHKIAA